MRVRFCFEPTRIGMTYIQLWSISWTLIISNIIKLFSHDKQSISNKAYIYKSYARPMSSPEDNEFFNSLLNRSWQLIKGSLPGLPVSVSQCITSTRKWWVKPCWLRVSNIYCLMTGWWFQTFFIFHNIWDNPSHWLIFFKMVEATNQMMFYVFFNHIWFDWLRWHIFLW